MVSSGTELSRALPIMVRRVAFDSMSPPPARAATSIWRISTANSLPRFPLAAVAVAAHGHVEDAERLLVGAPVDDLVCADDQARTGRERREAAAQRVHEWCAQLGAVEQLVDGGRLAAREEDGVDACEMLGSLDERDVSAEGAERLRVLAERAL